MLSILSKPREQVTPTDVQELVATRAQENETLEFKADVPSKKGKPDPWTRGEDRIGDYAKQELLDEAVAFANAYGGALVIGISETKGVATDVRAVARCKELAERLRYIFRDCIDPPLPHVEIFGVETQSDAGVVIVRAPKSRLAPHRNKKTLQCPIRRSDRCEPMTMRAIQDMTINLSRGLQYIEEELARRSKGIAEQVDRFYAPYGAYGLRFTAIPVADDIRIDRLLHGHQLDPRFKPPTLAVMRRLPGQDTSVSARGINTVYQPRFSGWRPRLRAARNEYAYPAQFARDSHAATMYRELHFHGLIEMGLISVDREIDDRGKAHLYRLHRDVPVVEFATLAMWADQVRAATGAPMSEYAIDVEIVAKVRPCEVIYATTDGKQVLGRLEPGSTPFPRYALGDTEQLPQLLEVFERDFLNACGTDLASQQGNLAIKKHRKS